MDDSIRARTPKKRSLTLTLIQVLLAAAFLVVLWFSFGQTVLAPQQQQVLPQRLGHLELVSVVQGQQAIAQVARLHGVEIALVNAYIGQYGHQGEEATLWVGVARNADDAANLISKMLAGINKGGTTFHNLKQIIVEGQEVYRVDGPGGQHFFYNSAQIRENLVWLTASETDALSLIKQAVKTF